MLSAYWLRDLANKAVRRVKKLIGRPDNTPWVLRPRRGGGKGPYVDFVIGIDFLHTHSHLIQLFHEAFSPLGLSLLVANKHNVGKLMDQARRGSVRPLVYLDLCSATNPAFGELLKVMSDVGVHTIGDPAKLAKWTWKARAQKGLEDAGMPVPPTVLIRAGEPSRELTAEERAAVGERCVIKPSWGVAGQGVVAGVKPTRENIEQARQFETKDDYLVQRMIKWEKLGTRAGYVRAYNVLGCRTMLWWSPETRMYDMLTWDDLREHDLMGAVELIDRMETLTGMDYFSSEIAVTSGVGQPRFVLIDYCNDQCDMNPVSVQADGPPDEWTKWVCRQFAQFVSQKKSGEGAAPGHSLWLAPSPDGAPTESARLVSAA